MSQREFIEDELVRLGWKEVLGMWECPAGLIYPTWLAVILMHSHHELYKRPLNAEERARHKPVMKRLDKI